MRLACDVRQLKFPFVYVFPFVVRCFYLSSRSRCVSRSEFRSITRRHTRALPRVVSITTRRARNSKGDSDIRHCLRQHWGFFWFFVEKKKRKHIAIKRFFQMCRCGESSHVAQESQSSRVSLDIHEVKKSPPLSLDKCNLRALITRMGWYWW